MGDYGIGGLLGRRYIYTLSDVCFWGQQKPHRMAKHCGPQQELSRGVYGIPSINLFQIGCPAQYRG